MHERELPHAAIHLIRVDGHVRTLVPVCPHCCGHHLHGDPGARREWQLVAHCHRGEYIVHVTGDRT